MCCVPAIKPLAAATLAGDMLKGTFAVVVVNFVFGRDAAIGAALGAFLGHLFPVWLGFKGGKGVATYIGLLLGFGLWIALLAFCLIWLGMAALFRYSSLAALTASRGNARRAVVERRRAHRGFVSAADGAALHHPSRQYRAADQRHREQNRPEVVKPGSPLVPAKAGTQYRMKIRVGTGFPLTRE